METYCEFKLVQCILQIYYLPVIIYFIIFTAFFIQIIDDTNIFKMILFYKNNNQNE
jgi:hypothetical protein